MELKNLAKNKAVWATIAAAVFFFGVMEGDTANFNWGLLEQIKNMIF